jgi:hypothetical protein
MKREMYYFFTLTLFTDYILKNAIFWDVTPCGSCIRTDISPKHRFLQEPRGVASQKTEFFIVTAMKTSNLTGYRLNIYNIVVL